MSDAKQIEDITDLIPDPFNANAGTERGVYMLDISLEECGAGRSILVDKNGVVLAGNKTLERAIDLGFEIEVVPDDGKKLLVRQRTDLDLLGDGESQKRARRLATLDNRSSEVGLEWDLKVIRQMAQDETEPLDGMFFENEIKELLVGLEPFDPDSVEFPEYDESIADSVKYITCPKCGETWPV